MVHARLATVDSHPRHTRDNVVERECEGYAAIDAGVVVAVVNRLALLGTYPLTTSLVANSQSPACVMIESSIGLFYVQVKNVEGEKIRCSRFSWTIPKDR